MSLRKSAAQLSIINIISIALSFCFHIFLGRKFGISSELDCFFVSLTIFGFLSMANLFITSLLLPFFNEIKANDAREGFVFADVVFKWSLLIGVFGWFIVFNFGPIIIKIFASGFDDNSVRLSSEILNVLFIGYAFNNLTISITVLLNALYFFLVPGLTGLLNPIFNILAIFFLAPRYGVQGIAVSYTISNTLQFFMLVVYLFVKTQWRPTLKIYHKKLPELFLQSAKSVVGGFIWNSRDIISRNIASQLGTGTIALFVYAEKIITILSQIIITPISSVFYSKVSEFITNKKWEEVKRLLIKTIRMNVLMAFSIAVVVVIFIKPIMNFLFLGSKFSETDINIIFYMLLIEIILLVLFSIESLLVRIIYSVKYVNVVLVNATIGVAIFYFSSLVLSRTLSVYGLAISVSITQIFVSGFYFYFVRDILIKRGIKFL